VAHKLCSYLGAGITKGSFIRVSDGDRRLSSYEVQIMLSSRGQPRDDEQPVPGTSLGDLNGAAVEALVSQLRVSRPFAFKDLELTTVLRRAKVLVPGQDGGDVVSLTGLLALGSYPQEHFPQLMITFVHYPTPEGAKVAGGERFLEDVPLPGETRTVCENRGPGIRAMLDSLIAAGMSPPQFEDRISSFTVTFPNHSLLSEETVSWIASLGQHGLSDSQCIALALLREQGSLDNRAYRTATGVDSRVATAELQDLVARELLVQAGTRRGAQYRLSPLLDRHPNGPSARTDRRPAILAALGGQTLSRSELSARTGLNDATVRRWLTIMRNEGTIELVGSSPRSRDARYRRTRN